MGGVHRIVETADFRGANSTAVMGAVELDLRGAKIADSPAVMDVFALWGGIELTVPPEWKVEIQVVPILGGVENKARSTTPSPGAPEQVLIVRGTALMGGVEIKN
jgi:predicted membrane protein